MGQEISLAQLYGLRDFNEDPSSLDAFQLRHLHERVGAKKLLRSCEQVRAKWGRDPYLSELRRRYPHAVKYPPAREPIPLECWVYLLVCADGSRFKVGMSGRWESRLHDFSIEGDLAEFDLDATCAVEFSDRQQARRAERSVLSALTGLEAEPPPYRWGSAGHTEWRLIAGYDKALRWLVGFECSALRPTLQCAAAAARAERSRI